MCQILATWLTKIVFTAWLVGWSLMSLCSTNTLWSHDILCVACIFRSSPGDDLIDWNSGVSVRPYMYVRPKYVAISALTLLVGWQEGHSACKKWEYGGGGHWLLQMKWRPAGQSVCLPLLVFPCTIKKSRSSLLAPAHPGGPGKRATKRFCAFQHKYGYIRDDVFTAYYYN